MSPQRLLSSHRHIPHRHRNLPLAFPPSLQRGAYAPGYEDEEEDDGADGAGAGKDPDDSDEDYDAAAEYGYR
jgi:hypothetical protein